jgi:hypothetical protein
LFTLGGTTTHTVRVNDLLAEVSVMLAEQFETTGLTIPPGDVTVAQVVSLDEKLLASGVEEPSELYMAPVSVTLEGQLLQAVMQSVTSR